MHGVEALARERAQLLNPLVPWYQNERQAVPASTPFGVMRRVSGPMKSAIRKHNETFAMKKKRPKDYSSDSSASAKSTADGKTEGRIYRMPSGSSKDYYVYWKGKKISFGDSSMRNRNNNDAARANFMARHNCAEKKDKSKVSASSTRLARPPSIPSRHTAYQTHVSFSVILDAHRPDTGPAGCGAKGTVGQTRRRAEVVGAHRRKKIERRPHEHDGADKTCVKRLSRQSNSLLLLLFSLCFQPFRGPARLLV